MSYTEKLMRLLRSMSSVDVQNRLMICSDREIALSCLYMRDIDRDYLLSFLSRAKSLRVREEIQQQEHQYITYRHYEIAVMNLMNTLQKPGKRVSVRSYLRPRNRRIS